MGQHPNVILLMKLQLDDLPQKTLRVIKEKYNINEDDYEIKIGEREYHIMLATDYDDDWQIAGLEGDIHIFNFLTYDYGDTVNYHKVGNYVGELKKWVLENGKEFNFTEREIVITANYW